MLDAVTPPGAWPEVPAEMSVSTLNELESCPKRWALSRASYPELWDGPGYPPRVHRSSLSGSVIHLAIERIIKGLQREKCFSLSDPCAPAVVREMGGYTAIILGCIDDLIAKYAMSPRVSHQCPDMRTSLESSISDMRLQVQSLLRTLSLGPAPQRRAGVGSGIGRVPLTQGTYTEVELKAAELGWRGIADLLVLGSNECEIRDFKTGAPRDEHEFQVRVYAVLWHGDRVLNPTGRLATKLTISYPSRDVSVSAPDAAEMTELAGEMRERADAAKHRAEARPPDARPSLETCTNCDVRQLCPEYWEPDTQRHLAAEHDAPPSFGDLQVRIVSRRGPITWDARVERSAWAAADEPIVLLAREGERNFKDGDVLRVLDAHLPRAEPDDAEDPPEPAVASLTSVSEVYTLSALAHRRPSLHPRAEAH